MTGVRDEAQVAVPPVLFIVFNRPDLTALTFEAIRQAQPRMLYVAADGPRVGRDEQSRCEETRRIATQVDWDCEVRTLFAETNLGCRRGVQAALDWFFSHEEEGIVLEDDCLPDPTFYPFVTELLDRYRDDDRVMMISGDYFAGDTFPRETDYYFSRNSHIWGWATWRRAWQRFDAELEAWPAHRDTGWLVDLFDGEEASAAHWSEIFDAVHRGDVDTWDYSWTFSMWNAGGISIQPTVNLVTNLGFGPEATHTGDVNAWQSNLATVPMSFPLRHPSEVKTDAARDHWTNLHVFGSRRPPLGRQIWQRLRRGW